MIVVSISQNSTDPDGGIVDWRWEFGDGATGSGAQAVHAYTDTGTYIEPPPSSTTGGAVTTGVSATGAGGAGGGGASGVVAGGGGSGRATGGFFGAHAPSARDATTIPVSIATDADRICISMTPSRSGYFDQSGV